MVQYFHGTSTNCQCQADRLMQRIGPNGSEPFLLVQERQHAKLSCAESIGSFTPRISAHVAITSVRQTSRDTLLPAAI